MNDREKVEAILEKSYKRADVQKQSGQERPSERHRLVVRKAHEGFAGAAKTSIAARRGRAGQSAIRYSS